jgi:hypothetical protein
MTPINIFNKCFQNCANEQSCRTQCIESYLANPTILTECFKFPFENFLKRVFLVKFEILAKTKTKTNSYNMFFYLCQSENELQSSQICGRPNPRDECSQIFVKGIGIQYVRLKRFFFFNLVFCLNLRNFFFRMMLEF